MQTKGAPRSALLNTDIREFREKLWRSGFIATHQLCGYQSRANGFRLNSDDGVQVPNRKSGSRLLVPQEPEQIGKKEDFPREHLD
jgi:hypothetical protein